MSDPNKAVFLSYASQDKETARRICEALRGIGLEVWFDVSELRGGDAWDQKIRKQIKECALFVPLITATTNARTEGYFRLEWKLAVDRSHLLADDHPFLFPIAVGDVEEGTARVPDKFREVQWTRLRLDETPGEIATRISRLLGGGVALPFEPDDSRRERKAGRKQKPEKSPSWMKRGWMTLLFVVIAFNVLRPMWRGLLEDIRGPSRPPKESRPHKPGNAITESVARELAKRARAIYDAPTAMTRERLAAAEGLCAQALKLDDTDAEVWAAAARVDAAMVFYGFDTTETRRQQAQQRAARAMALAPTSYQARFAQAAVYALTGGTPAMQAEAEKIYRELLRERPDDKIVSSYLATTLRDSGRNAEAAELYRELDQDVAAGWNLFLAGRFEEAEKIARELVDDDDENAPAILLKATNESLGLQDPEAAARTAKAFSAVAMCESDAASRVIWIALFQRDWRKVIEVVDGFPGEIITDRSIHGPKRYFSGLAHDRLGRADAAREQWKLALQQVSDQLAAQPNDRELVGWHASLLARLGQKEEAEAEHHRYQSLAGRNWDEVDTERGFGNLLLLGKNEEALAALTRRLTERKAGWQFIHALARFGPEWDGVRDDPRFGKLLRENLPPGAKEF